MVKRMASHMTARRRLLISTVMGVIAGGLLGFTGKADYAPLVGWDAAAIVYTLTIIFGLYRLSSKETKAYAELQTPGTALADTLLIGASLASLIAVLVLVSQGGKSQGAQKLFEILLTLFSVILSWVVVHLTFMLRYARLYYKDYDGGVDFNQEQEPNYVDFAYLAFTLGMTFQVSDTNLQTREIRSMALRHAILSYIFGSVIIAATINSFVQLSAK